ncbi:GNAT family N-acetyltransferase [Anaerotruncus colihominis]|uniref:GNAT family N-acetyltransferase n=1 Tax=Anaerotruncus colihominis TaxID=169435 RepID=UPI003991BDE4
MKLIILLAAIVGKWLLCLWIGLGLIFLLFWLKGKQLGFNSDRWDDFFITLPSQKVERYTIGIYLTAALLSSGISYLLLEWAGFRHSLLIAGALFAVGGLITEYRWFTKKRDYVLKKYQEIPQAILERRNGENKMNEQIVLREYRKSDRPALIDIIRYTWQYDKFASGKTAQKLAGAYLDSCLTNQTFTQVALVDEIPVGIIMVKNRREHKCPLSLRLNLIGSVMSLLFSKEGRMVTKIFTKVEEIDRQLLKDSRMDYQGEVAFFAVNSKYRGMGLGRKLFEAAQDYMKDRQIGRFFLFTDTTCNYPFYEHRGMKRRGEHTHTFEAKEQLGTLTLFIYDYQMEGSKDESDNS